MASHALPPADGGPVDLRRAPRHALSITRATVRGLGEEPGDAKLVDLSIYGCRLQAIERQQGERLWLRFDGSWPVGATVVWVKGDRVGCRFDEAIPNALMRQLAADLI